MKQKYSSYKLLALSSALSALSLTAAAQNANVVYQDSNVRFTLVTDGTVRMEYAPDGKFLDKVVHCRQPLVSGSEIQEERDV